MCNYPVKITIPARTGDKVMVKNYRIRCREHWEEGEVQSTAAYISRDLTCSIQYTVILTRRRVGGRNEGKCIRLYVSHHGIKKVTK